MKVRLVAGVLQRINGVEPTVSLPVIQAVADFRRQRPSKVQADRAYQLCEEGLLKVEIARQLGVSKSRVTKLLHDAYSARGQKMPDGRSRRAHLAKKHLAPPVFEQIADDVKALWDEGLLMEEIAERVRRDKNTVTKAVAFWHSSRGLPVPDGRTRRKDLDRKVRARRRRPGDDAGPHLAAG
jgi:transposase